MLASSRPTFGWGLTIQEGPWKDTPNDVKNRKRQFNIGGGGVPQGGTLHAGNAYWKSRIDAKDNYSEIPPAPNPSAYAERSVLIPGPPTKNYFSRPSYDNREQIGRQNHRGEGLGTGQSDALRNVGYNEIDVQTDDYVGPSRPPGSFAFIEATAPNGMQEQHLLQNVSPNIENQMTLYEGENPPGYEEFFANVPNEILTTDRARTLIRNDLQTVVNTSIQNLSEQAGFALSVVAAFGGLLLNSRGGHSFSTEAFLHQLPSGPALIHGLRSMQDLGTMIDRQISDLIVNPASSAAYSYILHTITQSIDANNLENMLSLFYSAAPGLLEGGVQHLTLQAGQAVNDYTSNSANWKTQIILNLLQFLAGGIVTLTARGVTTARNIMNAAPPVAVHGIRYGMRPSTIAQRRIGGGRPGH
jgi:hypothetical protein